MALDFNKFAAKGNEFIGDLALELGYPHDLKKTGRVLKAVLHALRNHMTLEESVQLLAQLPMFLKAVYVENWSSKKNHRRIKHLDEFFQEIREADGNAAISDFLNDDEVSSAVTSVFVSLRKYVSLGELEDIKATLPKELKGILNSPVIPS